MVTALAVAAAVADVHTFAPNGAVGSNGWVTWGDVNNWTNEAGEKEKPASGDDIIITGGKTAGGCIGEYSNIYYRTSSNIGLSGSYIDLKYPGGTFYLEAGAGNPNYWLTVHTFADHDVVYDIAASHTLSPTEAITGSGRIVKRGLGAMTVCNKPQIGSGQSDMREYSWKGTVIEQGTFGFASYAVTLKNHQIVFSGNDPSSRFKVGGQNLTIENPDIYETNGVDNTDHAFTCDSVSTLVLTGTPKHENTVFTGRILGKLSIDWAPSDSTYALVLSNGVSTTTGSLTVSGGAIRLSGGATFGSLYSLIVKTGAKFIVDAGSGAFFRADSAELGSGVRLELGDDVVLRLTALNVNGGAVTSGIYGGPNAVDWISGNGIVVVGGDFDSMSTWTANGADTLITTPANWGESTATTGADLLSGSSLLRFGDAGAVATLPSGVFSVYGIEFSRPFALAAAADAGPFALGAGGMTFVGLDDATIDVAWPLHIADAQKWNPGSNWTVNVNAPISGSGDLTIDTKGTVNFNAPSTLSGNVSLSNGKFYINATNAIGGADGMLNVNLGFGTYVFAGHTAIDRPMTAVDNSDNNYKPFNIAENAEIDFNGKVSIPYKQRSVYVGKNATVRFNAGFTASTCFQLNGDSSGRIVFDKVAAQFNDRFYANGPTIEFRMPGNKINGNVGYFSSRIRTLAPYALTNVVSGTNQRTTMYSNGVLDLCGYDQALGVFSGNGGKVTSDSKATFHLVDDYANSETQFNIGDCNNRTNRIQWTGLACLSKEGSYGYWMRAASSTYGDLSVSKGTLCLMPDCSWANATNITATGTGILDVQNAAAFGEQAIVTVDSGAKMKLGYSGSMRVRYLFKDGERQRSGTYGATGTGARYVDDSRFEGPGVLNVHGDGIGAAFFLR